MWIHLKSSLSAPFLSTKPFSRKPHKITSEIYIQDVQSELLITESLFFILGGKGHSYLLYTRVGSLFVHCLVNLRSKHFLYFHGFGCTEVTVSFLTVLASSTNPRMSVPHVEHVERNLSSEQSCVELRIKWTETKRVIPFQSIQVYCEEKSWNLTLHHVL